MGEIDGSKWRLRTRHPRRDMPLRVTDRAGNEIGRPGQTCEDIDQDVLASLLRNDFVEPVPGAIVSDLTVDKAAELIADADADELDEIAREESSHKDRSGIHKAIEARRAELSQED